MLEIVGAAGQLNIEVQHVELERRPDYGTMEWRVQVRTDDLTGKQDKISIWPIHYERFLDELVILERLRHGTASLKSMSPEELLLTFRNLDKLGHMMLEGQLGHYTYIRNQFYFQKIVFAFESDPSLLPDLLSQFLAFKIWS